MSYREGEAGNGAVQDACSNGSSVASYSKGGGRTDSIIPRGTGARDGPDRTESQRRDFSECTFVWLQQERPRETFHGDSVSSCGAPLGAPSTGLGAGAADAETEARVQTLGWVHQPSDKLQSPGVGIAVGSVSAYIPQP